MLNCLNSFLGPQLTATDLSVRMRSMIEMESIGDPDDASREECLEIFEAESVSGTARPAIIGQLGVSMTRRLAAFSRQSRNWIV